jgi:hypothetical protein
MLKTIDIEKPDVVKFYCFYFQDIEKPVTIEAYNGKQAREGLLKVFEQLPETYVGKKVINQTVSHAVYGVSKKKISGIEYVWVGHDSPSGWMPYQEYLIIKKNRR